MNAPAADLDIIVTTPWGRGGRSLTFELHSPSGAVDRPRMRFHGERLHKPRAFQKGLRQQLENLGLRLSADGEPRVHEDVIDELADIGHDLYARLFPPLLKQEYWRLRDKVRTLLLTSDEPWIPWELVKPFREEEEDDFLCLRFAMSRWLAGKGDRGERGPAQRLRIAKLASIAVEKSWDRKARKLAHVGRERKILSQLAAEEGVELSDLWQAKFRQVRRLLEEGGKDLLHFAGHGDAARIHLADRSLSPGNLAGRMEAKLRRTRPLVFLNACRVAEQGWSVSGLEGWAPQWVQRCGCGAFLAPLWAVNDERACDFAELFYQELRNQKPLGEAVRVARERLRKKAPHDPAWLAYCLYGHPDARIVFGESTESDPVPREPPVPPEPPEPPVPPKKKWIAVLGTVAASIALIALLVWIVTCPPTPDPPAVAVLGFETQAEDPPWQAAAIAELLHEYLAAGDGLRMIDREEIVDVERALERRGPVEEREKAELLRRNLGADYLVRAVYEAGKRPGRIRVRFFLYDTRKNNGRWLPDLERSGEDLFEFVGAAAVSLRESLEAEPLTPDQEQKAKVSLPDDPEVLRPYLEGLRKYHDFELIEARSLLEQAAQDGDHPLVRFALARTLVALGRDDQAREELSRAQETSGRLSWRKQLEIRARFQDLAGDWPGEAGTYDKLYQAFPEEVHHCIAGAEAWIKSAAPGTALETAERCRKALGSLQSEARLAVVFSRIHLALGDSDKALEAAASAVSKGEEAEADFLVGQAHFAEAFIHATLDDQEAFGDALRKARDAFARSATTRGLVRTCTALGSSLVARQLVREAQEALETCLRIHDARRDESVADRTGGDEVGQALISSYLASVLIRLDELEDAWAKLRDAQEVFEEVGDRHRVAEALANRGAIAHQQDRLSDAWDFYEEAARIYRELGDDCDLATSLIRLGELLFLTGFHHEARKLGEAALAIHAEMLPQEVPYDRFRLGEVLASLGHSDEARRNLESARPELEGRAVYGEVLLALARLELGRENLGEARRLASEAADELLEAKETELAILAEVLRLRALPASEPLDSAAQEIYNKIRTQTTSDEPPRARLAAALVRIRWEARGRQLEDADLKALLDAAEVAAQRGYLLDVASARRELEGLVEPEIVARLEALLVAARRHWTPRVRRTVAAGPHGPEGTVLPVPKPAAGSPRPHRR